MFKLFFFIQDANKTRCVLLNIEGSKLKVCLSGVRVRVRVRSHKFELKSANICNFSILSEKSSPQVEKQVSKR